MAAEDELALPQVPEAKPDDPEDVSWSLSTAEAMWARGEHLEGIKWVRKAAEAASEVEDDERALELAKAASELATIVARRSRASVATGMAAGGMAEGAGSSGAPPDASAAPTSGEPVTARSQAHVPAVPAPGLPSRPPPPPASRSSPPIPLPSRASQPPRSLSPLAVTAPPRSFSPTGMAAVPRPLATSDARQGPQAGRGILSNRVAPEKPKSRRRSRENLDKEARAAGVIETAPLRALDGDAAERMLAGRDIGDDTVNFTAEKPTANGLFQPAGADSDHTIVARLEDMQPDRQKSAAEWDASPTRNLTGDDLDHLTGDGDRKTAFAIPAAPVAPPLPPVRAPQPTLHDPQIQTTQAVRVVVWRDANGVHVAPAGTVVSAITIDAVLVVLEEGADLTAWLSQRER